MALKVSKINIPGILPNGEIEVDEATIAAAVAEYIAEHPITVTETDPTVPSWAKQPTKPTYTAGEVGAYSKPSGGIPKTDLASDVQTSLGKADTALQQHQSLTGYATETWVEGKGYQTAQDVQTAIAAIPDELPTVTASDNGKFLRVVNGAWAAQTVPSAEGASF